METQIPSAQTSSSPFLEAIFVAESAGLPMRRLTQVKAIIGHGLRGDRYAEGRGYYSKADPCEVTLIDGEVLDLISRRYGIAINEGQHRRNLIVRGLNLHELDGFRLQIGDAVLEYDRPRPPCAYVERLTQKGMARALGEGAGIAARVITGGWLHEGDPIKLIPGAAKRRRRLP